MVNYWAVLVAGLAGFATGAIWYGPLFGKAWMKLAGLSKESMKSMPLSPGQAMSFGLIGSLLTAFVLVHFADQFGVWDTTGAWQLAFWSWLGFSVPLTAGSWLWEGKPFKLFAFNAAQNLIALFVMAVIVAYWR